MDLEEFNQHIVPLRTSLLAMARSLTGDNDCAEDLVQETLLRLWTLRNELKANTHVKAFSLTVLRHKFYDQCRHQRKVAEWEKECRADRRRGHLSEGGIETQDEMALVARIIGLLPPLQSQIIRMKEIEGYESDEIVKMTGCTPEALRKNLSRARKRIREMYLQMTKEPTI